MYTGAITLDILPYALSACTFNVSFFIRMITIYTADRMSETRLIIVPASAPGGVNFIETVFSPASSGTAVKSPAMDEALTRCPLRIIFHPLSYVSGRSMTALSPALSPVSTVNESVLFPAAILLSSSGGYMPHNSSIASMDRLIRSILKSSPFSVSMVTFIFTVSSSKHPRYTALLLKCAG